MRRDCTPTWIDGKGHIRLLQRVRLGERDFTEDFLQATLHTCPELLPVEEFDEDFGPLVSLGREVDAIDNLYVSPTGKLTIVETKLWRNPEATRQVVAQILDYATRVSSWSYEQLEQHCRSAVGSALIAGKSLYALIQEKCPATAPNEPDFIDAVQKSLRTGRFLLLIVGDGIREGIPALLDSLHAYPRLLFTFGLVELQVYKDPDEGKARLIVPNIIANTIEVVRAVVRVQTTGHADVTVEIDDTSEKEERRTGRRSLSEEEFFEKIPDGVATNTVRKLLDQARGLGAIVQPRSDSVSVRLRNPGGTRQKLSLFVITTAGNLYTGWLSDQLETIGADKTIATKWVSMVANLVPGVKPSSNDPSGLSRSISIKELEPVLDDFVECLQETITAIRTSVG